MQLINSNIFFLSFPNCKKTFSGDISGSIFVRGIMDFGISRRFTNFRIFIMFGILHHVCSVNHSHTWFGNRTVMGPFQLVNNGWNSIDSRIDFRHDYDYTVLGNFYLFVLHCEVGIIFYLIY